MKESRSLNKAENNGGYSWVENSFIKELLPDLSGQATKVYLYLISKVPYSKKADPITEPISASAIAEILNSNRRSIVAALKELSDKGIIEKVGERGFANSYRLLATCAENYTGDEKKPAQGCAENRTPPEKETSQVDAANGCDTETGGTSKSILRKSKNLRTGLRPSETPTGCGPRRV